MEDLIGKANTRLAQAFERLEMAVKAFDQARPAGVVLDMEEFESLKRMYDELADDYERLRQASKTVADCLDQSIETLDVMLEDAA
jgi:flagellar biosynthesis/type III secretory pathway chaperone